MDRMLILLATAFSVDTVQRVVDATQSVDPSTLSTIIGTIVNAILAIAAVFHLFRKVKSEK